MNISIVIPKTLKEIQMLADTKAVLRALVDFIEKGPLSKKHDQATGLIVHPLRSRSSYQFVRRI